MQVEATCYLVLEPEHDWLGPEPEPEPEPEAKS